MGKKNSYQKIDDIFKEVINQNSIPVEIVFQISKDTYLFAKFKFKSFLNLFLCTQGKKPSMPWYYGLSYKSYKIVEGNIKKLQIVQDNQHGITIFFPLIEYKIKEFIVTPDVVTVLFNKNIRSYYFINTSNISPVSINLTLEKYSQQDASTSDDILIYQTNRTEHHIFSLIQSFFGSMLVPQSDNIKEILLIHTGMTPLTKQCLVKVTGESFDSYINKHSL